MELENALMMALVFLVFGTLAVDPTARLAIRPIVEAIVRLRESFPGTISLNSLRAAAS